VQTSSGTIDSTSTINLLGTSDTIGSPLNFGVGAGIINAPITGSANLTVAGYSSNSGGLLELGGVNTFTGNITIGNGGDNYVTLEIIGSGKLGGSTGVYSGTINNSSAMSPGFEYSSSSNQTLSGVISGSASLTKDTSSTSFLYLNGANTYTGATTITAGYLGGTGNSSSSAHTVNTGASIFGGTGSGNAGTYTCGALTFSAAASHLAVYSTGASLSQVVSGTITASSGFTVDLLNTMPAGTFTLISNTGTLPSTLPTIGTNNSGRTPTFHWTAGTGLTVTLI
jgi:autotransporter-associated beta strand protein